MRFVAALAALLAIAGCDNPANKTNEAAKKAAADVAASDGIDTVGRSGSSFDYRYAFRLPGDKLTAVLRSNADACERLGPTRCRIIAMRYLADNSSKSRAVLTLKIDPIIARAYGDAVTKTVTGIDGVLVDTEISGTDSTSEARSAAVINRLRDQLSNARAVPPTSPDASAAKARAVRLQAALETIAEVEATQGQSLATAPVLMTYESSTALTGFGSAGPNFREAGQTWENSLSRLLIVLGSFGPWLLLLIAIVLVLRLIVHGRGGVFGGQRRDDDDDHHTAPAPVQEDHDDHRNLIQRWFNRDEEPQHQPHG